ncbi:Bax inhibitor-1/YccA family protein [Nocardia sp. NPDC051832]|uniref:Bax inhibitor-1/YccA family protein n=1 Tax=Nocardia sp. NPDC051832 TaxID=3155673 RepID=UPI003434B42B
MRTTSNPVFKNLPKQQGGGGYANFGQGMPGAPAGQPYGNQYPPNQYGQPGQNQPYIPPAQATRSITIDDIVTKTAMVLGVLSVTALVSYILSATSTNNSLAMPLMLVGLIGGLALSLIAIFGNKTDNPALVLSYAAFEGLFLGAVSFVFANIVSVGGTGMIAQAVLGTFGVFAGMLVVYKTGAIRVTPRFTRMIIGAMIGVVVLMLGNLVASFFTDGGFGLRDGGPVAIIFSLVCIAIAAFSFLLDFDAADDLIRAQAPEKAAWSVAFGLTITLVWLYLEILRLLSYFNND